MSNRTNTHCSIEFSTRFKCAFAERILQTQTKTDIIGNDKFSSTIKGALTIYFCWKVQNKLFFLLKTV